MIKTPNWVNFVRFITFVVLFSLIYPVYGQESLRDVFTHDDCAIGCFMGIEPHRTSKEEVEAFFARENIAYSWTVTGLTTFYDFDLLDHPWISGGLISVGGSTVAEIRFSLHQPISPDVVFQEFGYPTHINGLPGRPFVIIYADIGLIWGVRLDDELIDFVAIRQLPAMALYTDLPPCEESTICEIPTRQEILSVLVVYIKDLFLPLST